MSEVKTTVSTAEAARLLGISRQAVLKRIWAGTVRARKTGRNYAIDRASLAAPLEDPILADAVGRLVRVYQPDRIYLFGSAARGDAGPDSDYDILVVISDDAPEPLRDGRLGYEALYEVPAAVDVVVQRRSYFDRRAHLRASLPGTVLREGVLLHAA